jgi:hypothetical protein
MKTAKDLATEYADLAAITMPTSPDTLRSNLRLAFYAGYQAGLSFAKEVINPGVCPDCGGKGGNVIAPNGAVVHFCNCEVPA